MTPEPVDLDALFQHYDSCATWDYNPKTRTLITVLKRRRADGHWEVTREVQTDVVPR